MADAKLTALTAASALAAADLFYVSQSAASRKATGTQLLTLVGTAYVPLAGGTMTGALTIASGTLTASAPALNITQTWNQGATQFESIAVDVTNTASGSSAAYFVGKTAGSVNLRLRRDGYFVGTGLITANVNTEFYGPGIRIASGAAYSWCQFGTDSTVWVSLYGEAAGALAQRNGTTQQKFRVYNTYTDSSNYERAAIGWAANLLTIGVEKLGTGSDRSVQIATGASSQIYFAVGSTVRWILNSSGSGFDFSPNSNNAVDLGVTGSRVRSAYVGTSVVNAGYAEHAEMTAPSAPATNSVRIYAEDNGSGKTRLMALFATGVAQQLAIEP